jgi:heme ABC exporter ATP-binding subunit CcmA
MPPAVRLRAAVALAGRFPALAGADLVVERGEVVVVEGANGAGKTTLLRFLAGLMVPASGEASVLGLDLWRERAEVRRRVGMLGHSSFLYDDLTVEENMRFAARAARVPTEELDEFARLLGLVGRLRRTPVGRLSAGQRRRAALAVVAARRPELWLLDEPHASLDASARAMLGELVTSAAAGGATVLIASHEPEESLRLADRVVTMAGGRVVGERRIQASKGGFHVA